MPTRRLTTPAALAFALALLPAAARAEDAVKEMLADSGGVQSAEKELSADAKAKLAAALEGDFKADADGKVTLYTAKDYVNPLGDPEKADVAWAVAATVGEARVAVAAFRNPAEKNALTIADFKVLAPAGAADRKDLEILLGKFAWRTVTADAYTPSSAIEAARAAGKAGADDAGKQLGMLFGLLHDMYEIEADLAAIEAAQEAGDAAAVKKAAAHVLHEYQEAKAVFEKSDAIVGAGGKGKAQLLKHVDRAIAEAKAAADAADAGNTKLAAKKAGDINCGACHGDFKPVFGKKRSELKIGDGPFRPGLDLPPAEGDAGKLAAAIAAAARKALLTIDQLSQ